MSGLDTGLALAAHGIPTYPTRDKAPIVSDPRADGSTEAADLVRMWGGREALLPGFYPGLASLLVVDVDEKGGVSGHASLDGAGHDLPKTWNYATPSGGRHYVYRVPAGLDVSTHNGALEGVDLRVGFGNVVCYAETIPSKLKLADAPDWALVAVAPRSAKRAKVAHGGGLDVWRDRADGRRPSKRAKVAAKRVRRRDTGHEDMFAAVGDVIAEGSPALLDRMRERYVDGWPATYAAAFDKAAADQVARKPLPPVSLELSKVERKALRNRDRAPKALALSEGAAVLDETRRQIRRFVVLPTEAHEAAVALWAVHTHLAEFFDSTPRLAFLSTEPGSGKSRGLEVLARLVNDPVETMNTTTAFLARRIDSGEVPPTVLFDEVDTLFGTRARDAQAEELRGILNSGHRRGASYSRAATRGKEVVLEEFATFAPVALAGLGELPDTIRTRAIIVPMRRRSHAEPVEPYRERQNGAELEATRARIVAWARTAGRAIGDPWPVMPDGIADRDADVWEPLLAVADAAGGEWPGLAREAALAIVKDAHDRPASLGIRLLGDVRRVLADGGLDRIRSTELLHELIGLDEAPWNDLGGKGAIDSRYLGRMFDAYGIPAAKPIRFGGSIGVAKGWHRGDFADAWSRYLPDSSTPTTIPLH